MQSISNLLHFPSYKNILTNLESRKRFIVIIEERASLRAFEIKSSFKFK